jgi:iron complex outermembrane receptor protein
MMPLIHLDMTTFGWSPMKKRVRSLLIGMFLIHWSTQPVAASGADSSSDEGDVLQEVTVTARRRNEDLEKVPVAVQAISASSIAEREIVTESDLQSAVPGLLVAAVTSTNQLSFAIRGQALDAFSNASPTVLTYVNEFQTGGTSATTLYDLQSVQVLKGPQGTLFGRNATGGAVLYTTTLPGKELSGYLNLTAGNYNDKKAEGAVTIPLTDWASIRLAGEMEKRDGYEHNIYLNLDEASIDSKNIRATVALTPLDGLENVTTLQYGRQGGYSGAQKLVHANINCPPSPNCDGTQLFPPGSTPQGVYPTKLASYGGTLGLIALEATQPFYNIYNDSTSQHDAHLAEVINKTTLAINDNLSIKNIVGYNHVAPHDRPDNDGSPFGILTIGLSGGPNSEGYHFGPTEQYSDELQLAGTLDQKRLNYIFGAYYSRDFEGNDLALNVGCGSSAFAGGCAVPGGFRYHYETQEMSRALFAQGSYEIVDNLHATLGYRQTWELVNFRYLHDIEPQDSHFLAGIPEPSPLSEREPSWTVGLDYQITPSVLLYVTQRGGFRVGGFSGNSALATPGGGQAIDSYKPEIAKDLELGIKYSGRLFDRPVRVNADVYEERVSDAQRVVYAGISSQTTNATRAKVDGFEFDALVDLTPWLQVGANYAYTDARYTDGRAPFVRADVLTGAIVVEDVSLGPYGDTPKQSGSMYARIARPLPDNLGQLVIRGDVFFETSFYFTNLAYTLDPNTRIGGYSLTNARIEWNDIAESKFHVAAFVKNVFNKEYYAGGVGEGAVVGVDTVILGTPRMFGVQVGINF